MFKRRTRARTRSPAAGGDSDRFPKKEIKFLASTLLPVVSGMCAVCVR